MAVIALGAFLRFYGLRWGLPNNLHDYSYHPDEFFAVETALSILRSRTLNPHFYNYPSLYIYLAALAISAGLTYGAAATATNVYLIARAVTVTMGTAAIVVTYWAGGILFGVGAGFVAALVLCIAPLHMQHSHFATVDVTSTLFVAATLGFAGLVLKDGRWQRYVLGGLLAGLAAGTKYNAGLVLLALIAAHMLRGGGWRALLGGRPWTAIGCAIAGFVISTPGSVLWTHEFLHGFSSELRHAAHGHGLVFVGTGNAFVYTLTSSLWYGMGPQLILFLPAVILALVKRSKPALAVMAFVIPYYTLISLSQVRFARYALPMFPGIAILTGWFVVEIWSIARIRWARAVWAVACCGLLYWSVLVTAVWIISFAVSDPRDQAARWVEANIAEDATIGIMSPPWFYSPPLSKDFGALGPLGTPEKAMSETPYEITFVGRGNEAQGLPKWAIVSDYESADALRLAGNQSVRGGARAELNRLLGQLQLIHANYKARWNCGGFWMLAEFGFANPPHDMRYVGPEITIYERKK